MVYEPNTPIPSLIIGLGGSGATTVLRLKEQLVNRYDGKVPDHVGLLVFDTSRVPMAQFNRKTDIELSPREFAHLGGDAISLIERVARNERDTEHIGSWLQADYYLSNLPRSLFLLEDGAGQFRQFGRLALFKDVSNPETSQFYRRIDDKLMSIQRASSESNDALSVFIVGSLVGGTAAGLFLDTAHLVRKIAEELNIKTVTRGYFFLSEAFRAVLPANELERARPRVFAGLRELGRFLQNSHRELDYPIHYLPEQYTSNHSVWRGKLDGQLYDLVYLVDGQRDSLSSRPLNDGISPSVADTILAFMDSSAGEYQMSYMVNVAAAKHNHWNLYGPRPFVGAMGTYSIILPIYDIIDEWSFRLALDSMQTLLAPERYDETTLLPLSLAPNQNEEITLSVEDEVEQLLRSRNAIIDPRDPSNVIHPTPLWPRLYELHMGYLNNENDMTRQITRWQTEDWMRFLELTPMDQNQDARQALHLINRIMGQTAFSEVGTSVDRQLEPQGDERRIISGVARLFDMLLGMIRGNGQREGGQTRDALNDLAQLHIDRFRKAMEAYIIQTLNGQEENVPSIARKGKLGWTLALLSELETILTSVLKLLQDIASNAQWANNRRNQLMNNFQSAEQDLRNASQNNSPLQNILQPNAIHRAQQAYLDTADQILDMERTVIARDIVENIVYQMNEFVKSAIEQLEHWRLVLATDRNSLYGQVYQGTQQAQARQAIAEHVPTRRIIEAPEWVEERYRTYYDIQDALNSTLGLFQWDTEEDTDEADKPRLRITLKLGDEALRDDMRGEWHQRNSDTLVEICRAVFAPARERESVLNYLAEYEKNPQQLAHELRENSGVMLSYNLTNVGTPLSAFYLQAHHDPTNPNDLSFLNTIREQLGIELGVSTADETRLRIQDGDDPFHLTLVSLNELLPLDKIDAYQTAYESYLRTSPDQRSQLHIFPSEVRAIQYEEKLQSHLKQPHRLLSNEVTVLLENIERFHDFLMLMAYRVISKKHDYIDDKNNHFVYCLTTLSTDNSQDQNAVDEWWLTKPSLDPSLLEAVTTFIFREEDYGRTVHEQGYQFYIDYKHVDQHLQQVQENLIPRFVPDAIQAWANSITTTAIQNRENLVQLFRIAYLQALRNQQQDLLRSGKVNYQTDPSEYDLISLNMLILDEIIAEHKRETLIDDEIITIAIESISKKTYYVSLRHFQNTNWYLGRTEYVQLDINTDPIRNGYPIIIPASATEFAITLRGDGITVQGHASFTFQVGKSYERQIRAHATRLGEVTLWAEVTANGQILSNKDEVNLAIHISEDIEPLEPAQLPSPDGTEGMPGFQPDATIRIYRFDRGDKIQFWAVAYVPLLGKHGQQISLRYRDISPNLVEEALTMLRQVVRSDPESTIADAMMRELGRYIWDVLLPPGINDFYAQYMRDPDLQIRSVLLIVDEHDPLPYELAIPRTKNANAEPLCCEFDLTRWIDGLGRARLSSFPVHKSIYSVRQRMVSEQNQQELPIRWNGGEMTEPRLSLTDGLADRNIFGYHITDLVEATREITEATGSTQDLEKWESQIKRQREAIAKKAPLVTVSTRRTRERNDMSDREQYLSLLRSGASGVVGTWWGVNRGADRVFWTAFYGAIYEHVYGRFDGRQGVTTLAQAVQAGRDAVRLYDPNPLAWAAYYAIGEPKMYPYRVLDAEGFLTWTINGAEKPTTAIETGIAVRLGFRFTTSIPEAYKGRWRALRPLAKLPHLLKLYIGSDSPLELEPVLFVDEIDNQLVEWQTEYIFVREANWQILAQMLDHDGQSYLAPVSDNLLVTGDPVPAERIQPLVKLQSNGKHEPQRITVDFSQIPTQLRYTVSKFTVGDATVYDLGEHDKIELRGHGEKIALKFGERLNALPVDLDGVTVDDSTQYISDVTEELTEHLDRLLNSDWWQQIQDGDYVTVIEPPYQIPWEMKSTAVETVAYWGLRHPTGYLPTKRMKWRDTTPERQLRVIALAHERYQQHLEQLLETTRTAYDGTPHLPSKKSRFQQTLDGFARLHTCLSQAQGTMLHLILVGEERSDGNPYLIIELPNGKTVEIDSQIDVDQINHFDSEPIIFLTATSSESSSVISLLPYIKLFLNVNAKAVISPICTLPDTFNTAFSSAFYRALYKYDQTLGGALMSARRHVWEKYQNPMGLAYLLFGDPQTTVEVD